jgi:hypothetical protein
MQRPDSHDALADRVALDFCGAGWWCANSAVPK